MRIAIIGAGICGLYLARKLAERGEQVTVFEKRNKIGKEVCSGLFSDRILEFIPESKNLIQNQIDYTLIHFPRKTIRIKFSRQFLVMEHAALDRLAADLAQKSSAKIILDYNVPRSVLGTLRFERVIGCDGALSETRRSLRLKDPEFYLGIRGFVQKEDFVNYVETWPTRNGFIWKIPRGKEVEWGIMEKPTGAKRIFDSFLAKNNIKLQNIKSWLIPQGLISAENSKVALCGDAAGLTKPWSGGGVVWALTAACLLLKTFPDFIEYQKELKKFFKPKITLSRLIKKGVYFLGFNLPWVLPKSRQIESDFLSGEENKFSSLTMKI